MVVQEQDTFSRAGVVELCCIASAAGGELRSGCEGLSVARPTSVTGTQTHGSLLECLKACSARVEHNRHHDGHRCAEHDEPSNFDKHRHTNEGSNSMGLRIL